jgi:hypothetical protein
MLQILVLKVAYLHYSVVMQQIVKLLVDPSQNHVYVLLLAIELETLVLSWAIFNAPTHLIFVPTWERLVVLDQI